jgi:hydrogenase-4 component B
MNEQLVLVGVGLAAASGVPGLFLGRTSAAGQWLATVLLSIAAVLGLTGAGLALAAPGDTLVVAWPLPLGKFAVRVDGLSAVFLLPIFVIAVAGSVYGHGYWKQADHPDTGRKLRLFYGLLTAAMALVAVAVDSILFLMAWEVMALSGFFLVTTEDSDQAVREAGWVYLAATHAATLCLFALFAFWQGAAGSSALRPLGRGTVSVEMQSALFLLALAGFGLKAGIMPLHVWLPGAHASAPSHVSAIMSGVIIKMGIYGLVRFTSLLPDTQLWWGGLLLGLGAVSGVLGVAFAIGQHDLKRLLAYHSIENIGIIILGLGLALSGQWLLRPDLVVLGMAGALLHVWNHALFKSLLFLGAGSVIHATHTRDIDHLGGLAKTMPATALAFLVGAVAICGLPPLNGFVSELFIYLGLFGSLRPEQGLPSWPVAALAAPALGLIGALALACFVKVFGAVFLGAGRSEHAAHAHEAGWSMLAPMAVLAGCCALIGLAPLLVAPGIERGILAWAPRVDASSLGSLAPLDWISVLGIVLLVLAGLGAVLLRDRLRRGVARTVTWDCGYAAPSPTMQYTSSSFAQMLVDLFGWALRPRREAPRITALFPGGEHFHSEVPDTMLDRVVLPGSARVAGWFAWLRALQYGSIQMYILYILATLLVLLLWP